MISSPRVEGRVSLTDGRHLGFAEFGRPGGPTVLWFHGTPGARRQVPPRAREMAQEQGLRVVGIERPGVGASTPHLYDSYADWADDIRELTDQLGVDRFAAVGLSGGGPYVLACASALPDRVVAGAVLGGVAPMHGEDAVDGATAAVRLLDRFSGVVTATRNPFGLGLGVAVQLLTPFSSRAFDLATSLFPEGDRRVFERPEMKAMFIDDLSRGSRSGLRSLLYDAILMTRPWGFALRDITVPIRFWHGDADPIVPLAHAQHMAAAVSDSELRIRPGESHLGGLDAAPEVLETIMDLWVKGSQSSSRPAHS